MSKKIETERLLTEKFSCRRCQGTDAEVSRLAMADDSWGKWFGAETNTFAFVVCQACGSTEVFSLAVLEGKDDLGGALESIFGT